MKRVKKLLFFFSIFLLCTLSSVTVVVAEAGNTSVSDFYSNDGKEEPFVEPEVPAAEISFVEFIKMIFAFLFVLLLIYLLMRFLKSKNRLFQGSSYIELLGGTSLGQNRSIQLVKVGDRVFVLGVGDSIQLLKEIDEDEEIERIKAEKEQAFKSPVEEKVKNWFNQRKSSTPQFSFKKELEEMMKKRSEQMIQLNMKGKAEDE
ncbi:flagellar biosynthetic protein FliO [Bacillus kexueae]|uniref:flagellar biosynthetic protein FliO n=1 Tax=Aeribacillus kexueae TaxID=2078952 RepID=UPI001FB00F57|nr:flagellar biosynthetic protein FliO [Bacillus kexueae]